MAASYKRLGDVVFTKAEKINAELLILTYGAMVTQLLRDFDTVEEVNAQLDTMGYNIGVRLIDEFLAKSSIGKCQNLKDTAEVIGKVAFKMFLGITANINYWSSDEKEFSIILDENPLAEFVELPDKFNGLYYSNLLCGVIRGALEMVQIKVECRFNRDNLRGDDITEIRVIYKETLPEAVPINDE